MSDKKNFCVAFTGDVAFSQYFEDAVGREILSDEVVDFLNSSDEVVTNVEAPITDREFETRRRLKHTNDPKIADFLKSINSRYWNLANNHIMDCGIDAVEDSFSIASDNRCTPLGVVSGDKDFSCVIIGGDIKVAIISLTNPWKSLRTESGDCITLTWDDTEYFSSLISSVKNKVSKIVMVVHGGLEFSLMPLPFIREKYHSLLNLGADIIVAHHPHVVQNYERAGDKIIFYSLGNFVFDTDYQRKAAYTDVGVLLKLKFTEESFDFESMAVKIDRGNMTISSTEIPVNFCDIQPKEYKKLWPLAARHAGREKRKSMIYFNSKLASYTKLKWFMRDLKKIKNIKEREILEGRVLSVFRLSQNNRVAKYIRDAMNI